MRIFMCKCVFLGVICVSLGEIFAKFSRGLTPYNGRPKVDLWHHTIVTKLCPHSDIFCIRHCTHCRTCDRKLFRWDGRFIRFTCHASCNRKTVATVNYGALVCNLRIPHQTVKDSFYMRKRIISCSVMFFCSVFRSARKLSIPLPKAQHQNWTNFKQIVKLILGSDGSWPRVWRAVK